MMPALTLKQIAEQLQQNNANRALNGLKHNDRCALLVFAEYNPNVHKGAVSEFLKNAKAYHAHPAHRLDLYRVGYTVNDAVPRANHGNSDTLPQAIRHLPFFILTCFTKFVKI